MNMVCLDLEGVLVPEIWIAFSEASGIPELRRTTRDEPDYDKLMRWRLGLLKERGLGLRQIQDVIATIDPLPGAKEFLDSLRELTQVVILSDTFEEFAKPLMKKLGWPTILCNNLVVGEDGMITDFKMRCKESKLSTVRVPGPDHAQFIARPLQGRARGKARRGQLPGGARRALRVRPGKIECRTDAGRARAGAGD